MVGQCLVVTIRCFRLASGPKRHLLRRVQANLSPRALFFRHQTVSTRRSDPSPESLMDYEYSLCLSDLDHSEPLEFEAGSAIERISVRSTTWASILLAPLLPLRWAKCRRFHQHSSRDWSSCTRIGQALVQRPGL